MEDRTKVPDIAVKIMQFIQTDSMINGIGLLLCTSLKQQDKYYINNPRKLLSLKVL